MQRLPSLPPFFPLLMKSEVKGAERGLEKNPVGCEPDLTAVIPQKPYKRHCILTFTHAPPFVVIIRKLSVGTQRSALAARIQNPSTCQRGQLMLQDSTDLLVFPFLHFGGFTGCLSWPNSILHYYRIRHFRARAIFDGGH